MDLVVQGMSMEFECRLMVHNVSFLVISGWCTQLRYPWKCLPTSLFRGGLKKLTEIDQKRWYILRYQAMWHFVNMTPSQVPW